MSTTFCSNLTAKFFAMKTRGDRLKFLRAKAGYRSARAAADALDIPVSTYNAHERAGQPGGRDFDETDAAKYARAFDGSMLWLYHGRGDPDGHLDSMEVASDDKPIDPDAPMTVNEFTGRRGVPKDASAQLDVTGGLGAGGMLITSEGVPGKSGMTFAGEHIRDYWRIPPEMLSSMGLRPHDIVIMPVQGDSMTPTINEGDCVFVDTRHRLPSPDGLYAITDEFGGLVVKRLEVIGRTDDDDIEVSIISDNSAKHPAKPRRLSDMRIIGRIIRRFGVIG